ncbi:MAG: hypothetical protein LBM99_03095 [Bacillales bacterium]|jgi:hypothetical protein|nr:hypothetical protein [Bacillales bacterium]
MKKKLFLLFPLLLVGCTPEIKTSSSFESSEESSSAEPIIRVEDKRDIDEFEYSNNSLAITDELGRTIAPAGQRDPNLFVGIFYHIWHGYHNDTGKIYDNTKLLAEHPDDLYNISGTSLSPLNSFHYWGEPMYGYYNSSDPWLINRHMEMLTQAGIDYLMYDLTNAVIYTQAINAIFEELTLLQAQGFKVPKVAFYTNSYSGQTVKTCYNNWYKEGRYSDLWFRFNDKPLIVGVKDELPSDLKEEILDFFDFRESQWPYGYGKDLKNGFPWMDWDYPQKNYNGTISVSLAQHQGARMSEGPLSNCGRGFDYTTYVNSSDKVNEGTNFQQQFDTVFNSGKKYTNVFITGFNEWIAIKMQDGERVFFVDNFNEEYSRDVEMNVGGYGDNYYLEMIKNVRRFMYSESEHYIYETSDIGISTSEEEAWASVSSKYLDFVGDAKARNYISADKVNYLADDTNRNDIKTTYVSHDADNLYVRVETKENITTHTTNDLKWMNLLIRTDFKEGKESFGGYDYIINRKPSAEITSVEKYNSLLKWTSEGEASIKVEGKVIMYSIPLSLIGLDAENFHLELKVLDNVFQTGDFYDTYIYGDSAPLGRLGYSYGY